MRPGRTTIASASLGLIVGIMMVVVAPRIATRHGTASQIWVFCNYPAMIVELGVQRLMFSLRIAAHDAAIPLILTQWTFLGATVGMLGHQWQVHRRAGQRPRWAVTTRIAVAVAMSFGAVFLIGVGKVAYDVRQLEPYRSYIETHYAPQIALIERSCRELPERDPSNVDCLQEERKVEMIARALSAKEISLAGWSSDGHHGAAYLTRPRHQGVACSLCRLPLLVSHNPDGLHSLRYGDSFGGRLLVYEGWVTSGRKRHYIIAFVLDDVKCGLANEAPRSPPLNR